MLTLGMYIGYSNLKLVWSDNDDDKPPKVAVYPAGVAPTDCISAPMTSNGYHRRLKIVVEGGEYVAGIKQFTSTIMEASQVVTAHDPVTTNAKRVFNYGRG